MTSRRLPLLCVLTLLGPLMLLGCASIDQQEIDLMPQTLSDDVPFEELEEPVEIEEPPGVAPIPDPEPAPQVEVEVTEIGKEPLRDDPSLIVIRSSKQSDPVSPGALAAASEREKERRKHVAPVEVINDKNLAASAEGGQLTIALAQPSNADPDGQAAARIAETTLEEEYWRSNALGLRLDWKEAVDQVADLEEEAAGLRRDFYDEDDPFQRDGEIKPAWDRSLEDLSLARKRVGDSAARLDLFLDEGRRAGALPGWLREGAEYEPVEETPGPARRREDPREPKIVEEDPDA